MDNNKLPNFLIVGAAKCGTSSLHNYLNQHPDIFMPTFTPEGLKVKEPRFLIKDKVQKRLPKGIWNYQDYKSLFDDVTNQKAIGESTVLYLYYYQEAIKNIKKYLGDNVKIIIMLRNPIDRAYSAYLFASRTSQENQNFKDALVNSRIRFNKDDTISPMILYKELGLYFDMVKSYMRSFSNVHVVIYDDFIKQTNIEVQRVFDFLNVNNYQINTNKIINAGGKKWDSGIMKNLLMGDNFLKNGIKILFPQNLRTFFKQELTKLFTSKAKNMSNSIKKELLQYYKKDIQSLEKLINKDLSKWQRI
tara:strand:- start:827 stop:1738 length:912 start_codon:yes stop_codon:yes gene_type:complete